MTEKVLKVKQPVRNGAAKVPVVIQLEALECGAACLTMVLAYYGKWLPLEQVRRDCGVSRDGSNGQNVLKAARSYGLIAKGYRFEPRVLSRRRVYRIRYAGVFISGLMPGIGGLVYTVAAGSGFQSSVAGCGFLALAVMIFGNWKPLNILGASLFFALFKIIGSYSGSIPFLPDFENIKSSEYIYLMLPKKSRAPKTEGVPCDKGAR